MFKFAHLSDIHVGAFRQPILQSLLLEAFNKALEICIERKVDFIVVSGELFDSNIPDMALANQAVKKLRELREQGIEVYVVYGSHDYSPTQASIVDLLESAGLFSKVTKGDVIEGKLQLRFVTDKKTGAKLVGISGRKSGIEREYFEILDKDGLEKESGFKIFVFHGAVTEYKPALISEAESFPISNLPKAFQYYAAGHIHDRTEGKLPGYDRIQYPGTLFAGDYRDLEENASGRDRGFLIVSFDDRVRNVEFVKVSVCDYALVQYDATNKNSIKVQQELLEQAKSLDINGKVVLIKVKGELSGGNTSDIDFMSIRKIIEEKKALHVSINHFGLRSKEYADIKVGVEDIQEVERKLFKENIGTVKVSQSKLKGDAGVQLSLELIGVLRQEPKLNELKKDYESRMVRNGAEALKLEGVLE